MDKISEFNPLKDYLEYELESFPDEDELKKIIELSVRQDAYNSNVGYRVSRIEHNEREKAFHHQWLKENMPVYGVNCGHGILQDLFIESKLGYFDNKTIEIITNRDRMIVATVIQWLGSNCGMAFLHDALGKFNYKIVEIKQPENV